MFWFFESQNQSSALKYKSIMKIKQLSVNKKKKKTFPVTLKYSIPSVSLRDCISEKISVLLANGNSSL